MAAGGGATAAQTRASCSVCAGSSQENAAPCRCSSSASNAALVEAVPPPAAGSGSGADTGARLVEEVEETWGFYDTLSPPENDKRRIQPYFEDPQQHRGGSFQTTRSSTAVR